LGAKGATWGVLKDTGMGVAHFVQDPKAAVTGYWRGIKSQFSFLSGLLHNYDAVFGSAFANLPANVKAEALCETVSTLGTGLLVSAALGGGTTIEEGFALGRALHKVADLTHAPAVRAAAESVMNNVVKLETAQKALVLASPEIKATDEAYSAWRAAAGKFLRDPTNSDLLSQANKAQVQFFRARTKGYEALAKIKGPSKARLTTGLVLFGAETCKAAGVLQSAVPQSAPSGPQDSGAGAIR
jgi:hypothetical protein